jgi:hypothetical protein
MAEQNLAEQDPLKRMLQEIEHLPPDAKEEYYRLVVSQIVRANPGGLTVSDICAFTNFDRKTIGQHLDFLVAVREAYKEVIPPRTAKYYPNGKLVHGFGETSARIGNAVFTFRRLVNQFGDFVYVQEKKRDARNLLTVAGGILVSADGIDNFIAHLKRAASQGE